MRHIARLLQQLVVSEINNIDQQAYLGRWLQSALQIRMHRSVVYSMRRR